MDEVLPLVQPLWDHSNMGRFAYSILAPGEWGIQQRLPKEQYQSALVHRTAIIVLLYSWIPIV